MVPRKDRSFNKLLHILEHPPIVELLGADDKVMKKLIAKNLYRRLKLNFTQHNGWTLVDYVNHAKKAQVSA